VSSRSYRTPLAKVRGLGAARSGTEHWWQARVTAVAGVPLTLYLVGFVLAHLDASRAELVASVGHPVNAALIALAMLTLLRHMTLGMQVIIEDYVHAPLAKLALLVLNLSFGAVMAALALFAILKMSFAG
jgi:succinate dehydrogenase / fumarate reductase, membrane anchor subunit